MVAKIKSGKSLIGALNYNERKVSQGKAELIEVVGYVKDSDYLSFHDKLLRLTDLADRNERTKTNTVHISLNFPNGEYLSVPSIQSIVKDYMTGIGFETQPYLVYRHQDAGHPHIHIVSTNIKKDGDRISLHYLGQNQSEKARKAIEIKFGLTKAEDQIRQKPDLKAEVLPAEYGKAETKRMITNILGYALRTYKFTSIPELNAVLQQYNITADRGAKDSRIYAKAGLVYWVLDKEGKKAGVPIKASSLYGKPTLKTLEEKFRLNEALRKPLKTDIINAIDEVLRQPNTRKSFQKALYEKGIQVILRQNEEGRIYGVTFIDQKNKAVFNGSDLGKLYSANLLTGRLLPEPEKTRKIHNPTKDDRELHRAIEPPPGGSDLSDILFRPEVQDSAALNKFKRKKRKGLNL
jgi:hypothetical protein